MRFAIFIFFLSISLQSPLLAQQPTPKIEWLTPATHDFGDIKQGKPVKTDFKFKNNDDEPIVVENVRYTCGCTASDWSEEVVPPGETGIISIEFDAEKPGYFKKKITVYFYSQKKAAKLYVEGFVE